MVYSDFNYGEVRSVKALSLSFSFISLSVIKAIPAWVEKKCSIFNPLVDTK